MWLRRAQVARLRRVRHFKTPPPAVPGLCMVKLVERKPPLQMLRGRLRTACVRGHLVLVMGDAGIGKTSVLRGLAELDDAVGWGACDALQTTRAAQGAGLTLRSGPTTEGSERA